MRTYKIRKVNKATVGLEISLSPKMQPDGFVAEALANWERNEDGTWKLKLAPKQEGAKTEVPTEGAQVV